MGGTAGRLGLVKVTAAAVAFADEATTTANDKAYQITAAAKRVWDRTAAITVKVDGVATGESYTLNRLTGTVTFATVDAGRGVVTVSGSYLPVSTAARCRAYSFSLSQAMIDDTDWDNAGTESGFTSRIPGMQDVSGTLGQRWSSDTYFRDALLAGAPVVLELYADRTQSPELVCWALLDKTGLQSALEGAIDADISFQGTPDDDGRVVSTAAG